MIKRICSLMFAAILVALAVLGVLASRQEAFHPHVEVEMRDGVNAFSLYFLFHRQPSLDRCERQTGSVGRTLLASCKECSIRALKCLSSLDERQSEYLSATPIAVPSLKTTEGVVVFLAANSELALASCRTAAEQSAQFGRAATCYAPDTRRPALASGWKEYFEGVSPLRWALASLAILIASGFLYGGVTGNSAPARLFACGCDFGRALLRLSRLQKQAVLAITDVLAIYVSLWLAFSLRIEALYVPAGSVIWLFAAAPLLAIPVFVRFGMYRAVIRFLGSQAVLLVFLAVAVYGGLFASVVVLAGITGVPRSVLVAHPLILLVLVGLARYSAREWLRRLQNPEGRLRTNVLIYGAGSAGVQLSAGLSMSGQMRPVGFVDDNPLLVGSQINGLHVYSPELLELIVADLNVSEILLALPSAPRARRNEIIARLEPLPVHVRTLPGLADLAQGKVRVEDLREVDIEDLLGRDPIPPNASLLGATITGKVVLVSGAGGSIGSELCRQILRLSPAALVLYENNEYALYSIEQELLCRGGVVPIYPILGSVVERRRMEEVLRRYAVQTVFHAAAYKHVPMVEKNPLQGVENNIFGTWHAAQAALNCMVGTFVLVSTDKAVRPTNTMGATKRFAEMILQGLHARFPDRTRFTMVRFGNVLGSSGSVVPLFREQIRRGGPITVTDPRIIRYFMTIPEAALLVIQAGAMGAGQDVFVLDMGEPVKIVDLARRMIHLSGLTEKTEDNLNGEIEIVFSGLRSGEKLYEELLIGDNVSPTDHPRILRADEKSLSWEEIVDYLEQLQSACANGDSGCVREILQNAVEEFSPQCGNEDLLRKVGG